MRAEPFKQWLLTQGDAASGASSRLSDARRVERHYGDLDDQYARDKLTTILSALAYSATDRDADVANPSRLVIEGDIYNGLASARAAVTAYRRFSDDEATPATQAERIRRYAIDTLIEPARQRGEAIVELVSGNIHRAMELTNAHPAVCSAIDSATFKQQAGVELLGREGPANSSTVRFRFGLNRRAAESDVSLLARFRTGSLFRAVEVAWTEEQRAAFCMVARAVHNAGLDWYHVNIPGSPVRFGRKPDRASTAYATQGYLVGRNPPRITLNDKQLNLGIDAAMLDSAGAAALATRLQQHADDIARWFPPTPPRPGRWPDEAGVEQVDVESNSGREIKAPPPTTNLILHGPPGTGKTYATARHAVRLCGEEPPAERAALMARYRELSEAGRIEFVTFHQSYGYEDFVEGLRPNTEPSDSQGAVASTGFRLRAEPGAFRRITALADQARLAALEGARQEAFSLNGRRFWKMAVGAMGEEDVYDAALAGGYVALGWGADVDWSDERFSDIEEMRREWAARYPDDATPSQTAQPWVFRNEMRPGDLVIVPYGNSAFRAIAEVVGPYYFELGPDGMFNQRRRVRWLVRVDTPLPLDTIVEGRFAMRALYEIDGSRIRHDALARLVTPRQEQSEPQAADPFVLVIDEINRGNISKIFGELITLLEPDKRLGATNALTVRLPYSGDLFGVPANLHIVATMNTADRSIALIDKALRRRFTFEEMMPDYTLDAMATMVDGVTLAGVLRAINERIEYLLDREHQIGHGWLIGCTTRADLDAAMRTKVIPLIAEYFFEDWGRAADVLGEREGNPFLDRVPLSPPPGMTGEETRWQWRIRDQFAADAYHRLIAG